MVLFLLQRGTPHVEILIVAALAFFLSLWAAVAFFTWLRNRPSKHLPEAAFDSKAMSEGDVHDSQSENRSSMDFHDTLGFSPRQA